MLTDQIADTLVPTDLPDVALSQRAVERLEVDRFSVEDDPLAERILYWNDLLQQVLIERDRFLPDFFGHRTLIEKSASIYLSTGFVELPKHIYANEIIRKARKNTPYVFGASLVVLEGGGERSVSPQVLDLGRFSEDLSGVPLIAEHGSTRYFSAPNLLNASSTCWAMGTYTGILTAAHTFSWQNYGQNVWFQGGMMGRLAAIAPYPIDGAIVDINQAPPSQPIQLAPEPYPQPNERYEFDGMTSKKPVSGKVTTVSVLPGVTDPMEPARVRLDTGGQPGDSGALVRSLKTGRGLSLYSGIIDTGSHIYNISQGLEQVANLFNIQLLE